MGMCRIMFIILLRGYSRSGKDFVGNILCKQYHYHRFAFADSLKKLVAETFDCPIEQLHSQEGKQEICPSDPNKRTYRQILIDEALRIRSQHDTIFAEQCCQSIQTSRATRIVITDWRYPIELDIIQQYFPHATILPVHLIRVDQSHSPISDSSEYHLEKRTSDYTIVNHLNDSIYQEIDQFIQQTHSSCIPVIFAPFLLVPVLFLPFLFIPLMLFDTYFLEK